MFQLGFGILFLAATAIAQPCARALLPAPFLVAEGSSSGSRYARLLKKRGIPVIHLQVANSRPAFYWGYDPADYVDHWEVPEDGNLEGIIAKARAAGVRHCLAGTDRAAPVVDALRERLGHEGNVGGDLRLARRDKALMGKVLGDFEQVHAASVQDFEPLISQFGWPLVVKVTQGVGVFGFHIANNLSELTRAVEGLIGTKDSLGNPITRVLGQPFLDGKVTAIDTVTFRGEHYVSEVLRYTLRRVNLPEGGFSMIYEYADVANPREEYVQAAVAAALPKIDKLGFRMGIAHDEEVDMGAHIQGPARFKNLELNPRVVGADIPLLVEMATGENPMDIEIDAILDPASFERRKGKIYTQWQPARVVMLISQRAGTVVEADEVLLRGLKSFRMMRLKPQGYQLEPTRDLATAAGAVFLSHPDPRVVEADTQAVRQFEDRVYKLK